MMGSLASLDDYVDWYNQTPMRGNAAPPPPAPPTGTTYDPMADRAVERPEPPQDPRAFTSEWARASGVYPGAFEPQGTQWPQYPPPPPKEVPEDRPNPLVPFSAYRSKPPTHRVGDIAAQNIIEQGFGALPAGRLGLGAALTLDPSEAEGGKADAAKKAIGKIGEILSPAHKTGTAVEQTFARPSVIERYVTDPQRIYKEGIYKRPDVIAAEANAQVAPEHPALKELFNVTRDDLYGISQQGTRQGNVAPNIWQPKNPQGSYAAENIMNPANAQRLLDTLTEARKYEGLEKGMVPWYVMDPAYQRLVQLVGPARAKGEYEKFNNMMTPFSASSDVMKEINRGTAARMMAEKGRFEDFRKYGGMPVEKRGADFPPEMTGVIPHLRHAPTHTDPAGKYVTTGQHGYGQDTVKIPLYTQASGVPQTGFQTAWPVPDAHFTRAVGMSDVRKNAGPGDYMGGSEYRTFAPWFRQHVSQPLGIEAVPTQALTWGAYAPQTGVKTPIGAGKLELISQRMWERAKELGVDPQLFRDQVLLGQQHSSLEDDNRGMGSLAAQNKYA